MLWSGSLASLLMASIVSALFNRSSSTWRAVTEMGSTLSNLGTFSSSSIPGPRKRTIRILPNTVQQVHVVILVHGWMGNPSELAYLQSTMERQASTIEADDPAIIFFVHSAEANDGRTSDGIEAGGKRLAGEVNKILCDAMESDASRRDVSLSFVGNSLGGLYARYALSQIDALQQCSLSNDKISQKSSRVIPRVFCTTATPHLGVSRYTYLPLPRAAEYIVAKVLKPTGLDLFRYTEVIQNLATQKKFLDPLRSFAKRIAYANAYSTDFQVPTATAGFLADTDSTHRRVAFQENSSFVELIVETPKYVDDKFDSGGSDESPATCEDLSRRLDALGWTKVFCDVRGSLPSVPLPFHTKDAWSSDSAHRSKTYTSRELLASLAGLDWGRWHAPFGHTVLVANSKNDVYSKLNAAGQPIMDQLASDLIQDILREEL